MNNNETEARRWLEQSKHDARAAEINIREWYFEIACFLSQQAAEKALKAFLYLKGERPVVGHSAYLLCKRCEAYGQEFGDILDVCKELDRYYIPTRYPNGLPGGIPHDVFTSQDAQAALAQLQQAMELIIQLFEGPRG
jgi:HEPN domain-containing protein